MKINVTGLHAAATAFLPPALVARCGWRWGCGCRGGVEIGKAREKQRKKTLHGLKYIYIYMNPCRDM